MVVIVLMGVCQTKKFMRVKDIEVFYDPIKFKSLLVHQKSLDHKYHNWHIQSQSNNPRCVFPAELVHSDMIPCGTPHPFSSNDMPDGLLHSRLFQTFFFNKVSPVPQHVDQCYSPRSQNINPDNVTDYAKFVAIWDSPWDDYHLGSGLYHDFIILVTQDNLSFIAHA